MLKRLPRSLHLEDWSLSAWMAGVLAVLVSYAGPLVIFIQAAQAGGFDHQMTTSWLWAISFGGGVFAILMSLWLKVPVVAGWSAPGTALLLSMMPGVGMPEIVGAYLLAALILIAIGLSGWFQKILDLIPEGIAAGMMAGILFQFGAQAFKVAEQSPGLVGAMLLAYLLGKRFTPRHAIVLVALTGFGLAFLMGQTQLGTVSLDIARPVFTAPSFSLDIFFSLTLPLVLVSLSGQYLPGFTIMRLSDYPVPPRAILGASGAISCITAFFGGITTVLAAISAAICTGPDAHPDPRKRYVAGIANGVFYLVGATFAGSIVALFAALPPALTATLAGLGLAGAIGTNLRILSQDARQIEASTLTFLTTASGVTLLGLGSAFWGVVVGLATHWLLRPRSPNQGIS
ncbi:MAG: benzoate/H(+) symporter BenE family transporter [Lautropia sp.]|nr:benzoate/H(+) symporter BenE family transporter [Lautropia sp.]